MNLQAKFNKMYVVNTEETIENNTTGEEAPKAVMSTDWAVAPET